MLPAAPAVVTARFQGTAGLGTTNYYYWVQAMYPTGNSVLSAPANVGAIAPAGLSQNNRVNVQWTPMPGAIGYRVFGNSTGTTPTSGAILAFTADSETGFADVGVTYGTSLVTYNVMGVARFRYSFAVDAGAVATVTLVDSDTIPINAIVTGGAVNSVVAVTSGGSATVAFGTSAGSSGASILAATAKATLSLDAVVVSTAAATPFKMTAAGKVSVTVATAAVTAGIIEGYVNYFVATTP